MLTLRSISICFFAGAFLAADAHSQISLGTAVDLALRNSPKIRIAQADYAKAHAALGEARDAYVPSVSATGGVGKSTGAPLGVPVVFSLSAQSLVFARAQSDYIRAAREGLESTQHALSEARIEVAEDATNTYVGLSNAMQRRDVLKDESEIAHNLVDVTAERTSAGVDSQIELTKSRRTAVQIRLQALNTDDEIAGLKLHLAQLTGLQVGGLSILPQSVPSFIKPQPYQQQNSDAAPTSEGIVAAFAIAKSKQFSAEGDRRSLFWPQVAFEANYSRVNTAFSSYLDYYPRFAGTPGNPNSENALGIGLQITLPLLDLVHRAKAHQSAADAARALAEAQSQKDAYLDGRAKLHNSALELDARAELASLDRDLAQNQLETVRLQLQANGANASGTLLNPRDELNARLQERSKYYDMLSAALQLQQTQVNLLRQEGGLADWIHNSIGTPTTTPTAPMIVPETNTPAVPGAAPIAPSSSPTGVPSTTTGTPTASTTPH